MKTSSLTFQVQHIQGTQNIIADTLSSVFQPQSDVSDSVTRNNTLTSFLVPFQEMAELQCQDPELGKIICKPEKGKQVCT